MYKRQAEGCGFSVFEGAAQSGIVTAICVKKGGSLSRKEIDLSLIHILPELCLEPSLGLDETIRGRGGFGSTGTDKL